MSLLDHFILTEQPETDHEDSAPTETSSRRGLQPQRNKDSVIGAGLTIEGKIEGEGDIRINGSFKGDVKVRGILTVGTGARIDGEISADTVTVGGQVEGNINASTQVNLLETGQLLGDLRARSLTVAAGSRMRGRVEFGWDDLDEKKERKKIVDGAESQIHFMKTP